MGHWTVSLVDWDMEILELSPEKISIAMGIRFPDNPFHFKRIMTMTAGSPDLEILVLRHMICGSTKAVPRFAKK